MFKKKNDVPDYVKRSGKYKEAKKEARAQKLAINPKTKKILLITFCAVLLVALIGLAIWLFAAPSAPGEGGQENPVQSGKFEPSLGVPDADVESFVRERYTRYAAINATFDATVTEIDIKHNVIDDTQDLVTVVATAESEICKKTFQLDLEYSVVDKNHWNLDSGNETVVSTQWNKEKLLGWWTGGTTAESLHELNIIDIDIENRRAHFFNQGREFYNEQIYHWNTGEIEILPSNDAAPYVIDYDGMKWNNDYMMFPTEEGQFFY